MAKKAAKAKDEAATQTATKKKTATKGKKGVAQMTKKAPKGTKKKTAEAKKATKKPTHNSRTIEVGNEKWARKKVAVLKALQELKEDVTKPQIIEYLDKHFSMNDYKVNFFCHELAEEGFVSVDYYEGDPKMYRSVTAKGAKKNLPAL